MANSAAVQFNIYNNTAGTVHIPGASYTGFGADGALNDLEYSTTGSVNLSSGDPIQIVISYTYNSSGSIGTVNEYMYDMTTGSSTTIVYSGTGVNYQVAIGGGTSAYIGFTGATGGGWATQTISNFQFANGQAPVSLNSNIVAAATTTLNLPSYAAIAAGSLTLNASANPTLTLAGGAGLSFSNASGPAISATSPSGGAAAIVGTTPIQIAAGSVNVDLAPASRSACRSRTASALPAPSPPRDQDWRRHA